MNIFRIMKSSLKAKIKEKFPFEVTYRVTGRCNLRCEYCMFPINIKELSTEQAKKAIKEFADEGTLIWIFSGGEPLLRKDIGELVTYAKDCGIPYVNLLTNGILLKSKVSEIKNLNAITFSLDGPEEIHNKLRGEGTFQKVIEAINIAKKEGMNFSIACTITKVNMANDFYGVKYVYNLAKDFGCRVNFQPVHMIRYNPTILPTGDDMNDFYLTQKEFFIVVDFLKKLSIQSNIVKSSKEAYDIMEGNIRNTTNNKKLEFKCFAGRRFCYINSDGRVAPVSGFMHEAIFGTKIGFVNAFYKLKHQHSSKCFVVCLPEKNLMHKLNFSTIIRYVPLALKNRIIV